VNPKYFLAFLLSTVVSAAEYRPVSVWTSAETPDVRTIDKMFDGDYTSHTVLLDDSRDSTREDVHPIHGSTPVTATFVVDLGELKPTRGIRMVAPKSWAYRSPMKVSAFACDDARGETNCRLLAECVELPPVASSGSAFVTWKPIQTRFVKVRILDSWNRDHSPGYSSGTIQYRVKDSDFRYRAFPPYQGWNGQMEFLTKTENYDKDFAGLGRFFNIQIAEVSVFDVLPDDYTQPNRVDQAFPRWRLRQDWLLQDYGPEWIDCFKSGDSNEIEKALCEKVLKECGASPEDERLGTLLKENAPGNDPCWAELYWSLCEARRAKRLAYLREQTSQIVYVKHCMIGGWTGKSSTEDVSDGEHDIHNSDFRPGSQLCLLTLNPDGTTTHRVLIEKPDGQIRDPNFSFDGNTLVFSMRENFVNDDFHLYTWEFDATGPKDEPRQITFSPIRNGQVIPCADIEPAFTAEGNLVFQSTRCGQQDDCWIQSSSNIYTARVDGSRIRRLGYEQVHTHYPQVMDDGRILYTRWEYLDRNHTFQQPLFTMNPDGTAQTEYYGNNSWFPCSILHARGIPGTTKVMGLISGHHVVQKGKLAIIDPSKGTQGDDGIEFIAGAAPDGSEGRQPSNVFCGQTWNKGQWLTKIDCFGQTGKQFQYPFPFDENHLLVTFLPEGSQYIKGPFNPPFGVWYMTADGERELLAYDPWISCSQSVARVARKIPMLRGSQVDLTQSFGKFYVQDIYFGPGLAGVERGTIKKIRVNAMEVRPTRIGNNYNRGMGGDTPVQMPPAIGGGTYDVKHVLGEVDVEEDGSCAFEVPANNAVYFQMIDEKGRCVQTMRSWSTLMPGETFACIGCHEDKRVVVPSKPTIASGKPAQKLKPVAGMEHPLLKRLETEGLTASVSNFLGVNAPRPLDPAAPSEGFSFPQRVQPILDRHCVQCHPGKDSNLDLTGTVEVEASAYRAFTKSYRALTAEGVSLSFIDEVQAFQKEHGKLPLTCWFHAQGPATMIPPYSAGSTRSRLMDYLEPSHYNVQLTDDEKKIIAVWIDLAVPFCGAYPEASLWDDTQKARFEYYQNKRVIFAEEELNQLK